MPKTIFHKGDYVVVGEPPHTEVFELLTKPDSGRYATLRDQHGNEHVGYLGRWATHLPFQAGQVVEKVNTKTYDRGKVVAIFAVEDGSQRVTVQNHWNQIHHYSPDQLRPYVSKPLPDILKEAFETLTSYTVNRENQTNFEYMDRYEAEALIAYIRELEEQINPAIPATL